MELNPMEVPGIVKQIAGFLTGVDRINFSQTQREIHDILRPDARGYELAVLKAALRQNLMATRLVASLVKLMRQLYEPWLHETNGNAALLNFRMHEVGGLLNIRYGRFDVDIAHPPLQAGTPEENRAIFLHFLNQMD